MDNLKEGSSWEREDDATLPPKEDSYDRLARLEAESMYDFINMNYGRGALQKFKEATQKVADNDYETGRVDGLLEAIKILM